MKVLHLYSTSGQSYSDEELGIGNSSESGKACQLLAVLGMRLRVAMGSEEILSRYSWIGGEFRPPTFRAYAESLDRDPWTVCDKNDRTYLVANYSTQFEGWKLNTKPRSGFMASVVNPYEYAYELWDTFQSYHPDLFQDGTFGV